MSQATCLAMTSGATPSSIPGGTSFEAWSTTATIPPRRTVPSWRYGTKLT